MLKKLILCFILLSHNLAAKELTEAFGLKLGTNISELEYQQYNETFKLAEGYEPPKPLDNIDDYSLQLSNGRVVLVTGTKKFSSREECESKLEKTTKKYESQYATIASTNKTKYFTVSSFLVGNGGAIRIKCSKRGAFSITVERLPSLPKIKGAFGLKFGSYIDEKEGLFIDGGAFRLFKVPLPKYDLTDYLVILSDEKRITNILGMLNVASLNECIDKQKKIIQQIEDDWKVIITGSGLSNKEHAFNISCKKSNNQTILTLGFMSL